MLEDIGLKETLQWHCNEFSILNGIACKAEKRFDGAMLTPEIKLDFFRICQEALNNILDHAQAANAKIVIEDRGGKTVMGIQDDGIGFDPTQQLQTPGLPNICELATSINTLLHVNTAPGRGTHIEVELAKQQHAETRGRLFHLSFFPSFGNGFYFLTFFTK